MTSFITLQSLPSFDRDFYNAHACLLCESFEKLLHRPLIEADANSRLQALFEAPFALASHGAEDDPIFNFANATALCLFEITWEQLIKLPSRESAAPINREERQKLLNRVTTYGFIDNYSGVRVSSTGRSFMIEDAVVWNLVDSAGDYRGQAAVFDKWSYL